MIVFKYHKKSTSKPKKDLDKILEEALRDAPVIQGFTIRELENITETPWTTTRFQREVIEMRNFNRQEFARARAFFINAQNRRVNNDTD